MENTIKGVNIKAMQAKSVGCIKLEDSITEQMINSAVCLLDSSYKVRGTDNMQVSHMDKCIFSGLLSMQMKKSICLYDRSNVFCGSDEYQRYTRTLPIKSILSLPTENATIKYSCFNPSDANLMFAGCD